METELSNNFSTHENTIKEKIGKLDETINTQEKKINEAVKKALELQKKHEELMEDIVSGKPLTPQQEATIAEIAKETEAKSESDLTAYDWFFKAYEAQQKGDHKEACEYYENATKLNPNDAIAYCNWGVALRNLEDYKEAIEKYKKAIEINPNYAVAYNNWGFALGNLKDYKGAIGKYKKAIEINSKNAYAYNNWGDALGDLEDYKEAIKKYKKAIEINPNLAEAYNNWGFALGNLKDYKGAIEKYKKAIEIEPNLAIAYNNWAHALNTFNTPEAFEEAIIHAKKAIDLNPKYPNAPKHLGNAYLGLKRYGEAIDSYSTAIDLKGDYLEAYTNCDTALDGLETTKPDLHPAEVEKLKTLLQKNKDLPALKDNEEFIRIYKKYCEGS